MVHTQVGDVGYRKENHRKDGGGAEGVGESGEGKGED